MKKMDAKQITLAALAIAVVCVSTMVIQIPIPLGYMHLGNCCILLFGVFFSRAIGTLAGGVGSCLADLLSGYPQWILPTLIIKGIMGYAIAADAAGICSRYHHHDRWLYGSRNGFIWKCGLRSGTGAGTDDGGCAWNGSVLCSRLCV